MYELDQTSKSSVRVLVMKKLLLRRIMGQLELIDQKDPESFRLEKLSTPWPMTKDRQGKVDRVDARLLQQNNEDSFTFAFSSTYSLTVQQILSIIYPIASDLAVTMPEIGEGTTSFSSLCTPHQIP